MKKAKKLLLPLLAICAAVFVPLYACTPRGAAAAFGLNRPAFERAAEDALAAGDGECVKRPFGAQSVCVWPNPSGSGDCVEFWMGGAGLGPSTSYWGVTYSPGGPLGFQGVPLDYVRDGDGWLWEEPGGDNWSRVTPLGEGWYLYEMHF